MAEVNSIFSGEDFADEEDLLLDEEDLSSFSDDVLDAALNAEEVETLERDALSVEDEVVEILTDVEPVSGAAIDRQVSDDSYTELAVIDSRFGTAGASMMTQGYPDSPDISPSLGRNVSPWEDQSQDIDNLARNTYRTEYDALTTDSPALRA